VTLRAFMTKEAALIPQENHPDWFVLVRVTSKYQINSEILTESVVGNF
jgi:hypothetical protein